MCRGKLFWAIAAQLSAHWWSYSADTTSIALINAQSAVVHELTHYLQGAYDERLALPTTESKYTQYLNRHSEQEAFATAAYFFTRKFNPAKFETIMSSNKSLTSKLDNFMNYHFSSIGYHVFRSVAQSRCAEMIPYS